MGMQISGLTGFDSQSIVSQLMSVERQSGQQYLDGQKASNTLISALQKLNGLFKTMGDSASALVPDPILGTSAWQSTKATSSNTDLATVTSSGSAQPGTLSFAVTSVAQAGSAISGSSMDNTTALNGGAAFSLNITKGSTTTAVQIGAGAKLADVAAAINNTSGLGVNATMVQVSPGQYKLQLTSTDTGANTDVTATDSVNGASGLGTFGTLQKASDTVLHVGGGSTGSTGFDITSPSATVKDVLPGVNITAVKADPNTTVTVGVQNDVSAVSGKVKAFVDSINGAINDVKTDTAYDAATKKGGPLNGESTATDLQYRLQSLFSDTGSAAKLNDLGIQIQKDGTVAFDQSKFEAAYTKDPKAAQSAISDTASKVADLGKQATNSADGYLTVRIQGEQATLQDYTRQIADFNDRMSLKQDMLTQQFSSLETMLSNLQSQGQWLSGQLSALSSK